MTAEQREQVSSCTDIAQLDEWFDSALTADTAADIFKSCHKRAKPVAIEDFLDHVIWPLEWCRASINATRSDLSMRNSSAIRCAVSWCVRISHRTVLGLTRNCAATSAAVRYSG